MKHLVFDINIVLTLWLGRTGSEVVEELVNAIDELPLTLWVSASSLPALKYLAFQHLQKKGMGKKEAHNAVTDLLALLAKRFSILSNMGYEQIGVCQDAVDFEDAQIALAAQQIHGEKRLVTTDHSFDTMDLIEVISPSNALGWVRELYEEPVNFIDLNAQQDRLRPEVEKNIYGVLHHGRYILGPEVQEFEEQLAGFVGVKHCVGVSSGTDALMIALMAQGIGPGDAVFTTPFTFIATAEVISLLGATPVFVDIDPQTYNLDPVQLEKALKALQAHDPSVHPLPAHHSSLTAKAIITVDLFGLPADYDPIMELAKQYNLFVLEDAAQGLGGIYKGRQAGSLGHAAATSFFPAKPLGCYGDGGAVLTDDENLAHLARSIRVHGKGTEKYDNVRIGLNARLHTLQASILLAKLTVFPIEIQARQKVAQRYSEGLAASSLVKVPQIPEGLQSVWAQYSLLTNDRAVLQKRLQEHTLPTAVYYGCPLHLQPAYAGLGYEQGDMPVSEKVSKQIVSLPMHPYLENNIIDRIVDVVIKTAV